MKKLWNIIDIRPPLQLSVFKGVYRDLYVYIYCLQRPICVYLLFSFSNLFCVQTLIVMYIPAFTPPFHFKLIFRTNHNCDVYPRFNTTVSFPPQCVILLCYLLNIPPTSHPPWNRESYIARSSHHNFYIYNGLIIYGIL